MVLGGIMKERVYNIHFRNIVIDNDGMIVKSI